MGRIVRGRVRQPLHKPHLNYCADPPFGRLRGSRTATPANEMPH